MAEKSFKESLALILAARFPVLYIESFEEDRVINDVRAVASGEHLRGAPRPVHVWTVTNGFIGPDAKGHNGTTEPRKALEWLLRQEQPGVFVMLDMHAHLGEEHRPADPAIVRLVRDVSNAFANGAWPRALVIVAPVLQIPIELDKDIALIDFPLPNEVDIRRVLDETIVANAAGGRIRIDVDDLGRERLAKAALGLTLHEATNAFARAMADDGVLSNDDVHMILEEKKQAVRKAGLLEFITVDLTLDDVGGLQNLKRWLHKRNNSWMEEARAYGLPAPKGVLMTGVPGCGKSLTAKAVAAAWELPLLRLDIGKVFSGLVGSSEQNMRSAMRTAEATAPCILWLDEIEKGFSGISSGGDSGTSSRVFGSFLTWMQEKTSPVFVIATANKVDHLPPEFLRKGRFDEIFFIDLPTTNERRDIWRLHLSKREASHTVDGQPFTAELIGQLAEMSEGYSGAEIEQAVVGALFDAFADRRSLETRDLERALDTMVPLSVTQAEAIAAVRAWAATRAVAATPTEDRSGYAPAAPLAESPDAAPSKPASPPAYDDTARGGRVVDF